ncbi:FecR family protein [Chitinophaga sp. HK235]|uniref:FecR family protein n=1 Tax=Chitinophaga sp. HK235 TaxID=2952571 RepID=UPI001BAA64AD|nr:FecR domain-containing protein [Chitinophaga sp. HK235]
MSNAETLPYELLGRYFSGEATPEEAIAVDDWIRTHQDNREVYDQVAALWDSAVLQQRYQLPDKETALRELKHKWNPPVVKRSFPVLKIAAGLALLVGVAAILMLQLRRQPEKTAIALVSRQTVTDILRDTLPDNSLVVLNSHSIIRYALGFTDTVRMVNLSGEAWFDVTSHPDKPFIVAVGDVRVQVLGTAFNVRQSEEKISVMVKSGVVRMSRGDSSILVKAGQEGIYNIAGKELGLTGGSFNGNQMGYATRIFNFENITLKEIVAQLEKAYGIKVILENKALENCTMSSSFENKPIEYVFDVISVTLNVTCRFEKDKVFVSGAGCN